MKKIKLLIAISALLISTSSFGQFFYSNLSYNVSVPLGSTNDFISKVSFRGLSFNVGRYITDNLAGEVRFTWATFYEARDFETYPIDDGAGAISGKQFRYINAYPLTGGLRYIFNPSSDFSPYVAGGIGAYSINERTDMGIYYSEDKIWRFGFYPEVGFDYDFTYNFGITVYARYDHALKAKDANPYSALAFGIGINF